ncbi:MGMT family protein [Ornithinimicrobium avium]|uniref:Cysteine methyltransferase n=1 Tax=Ornithinimicrobium avium TaxID=2283195 RepID=A0A345NNU8_9MICO|nr:MGMT family protein [Ornithinimicrobium avium]AXH96706.1 cysteine methyltransferase [Ornithinimicrobium avium]
MSEVEARVREAVRAVPPGAVVTYGDVAAAVGIGPRQAGRLVGRLSEDIPWWRVVHADGSTATCHGGTAGELLVAEGVSFHGARVDLGRHRDAGAPL